MITALFLDTDDWQRFSDEARAAVREVCAATEPEVRALLPGLTDTIELACQTGTFVIPETGEVGFAANRFESQIGSDDYYGTLEERVEEIASSLDDLRSELGRG